MDPNTDRMDTMADISGDLDELGELFEFGDIDLNTLPGVDGLQFDGTTASHAASVPAPSQHGTHPNTPFDELVDAGPFGTSTNQQYGGHEGFGTSQTLGHQQSSTFMPQHSSRLVNPSFTQDNMYQPSMQPTYPASQSQPPQYHFQSPMGYPGHHVPPTPNSYEMHGETGQFMQQQGSFHAQHQASHFQLRKDDATVYTPMVSPAGTPQFTVQPEFTIPGAYSFSPLTSPMIHAQNVPPPHLHQQGYMTNPSTAPSSTHTSPVDCSGDVEMFGDGTSQTDQTQRQMRKNRRKIATPRSLAAGASVRQGATSKPQKRKSDMSTAMNLDSRPDARQDASNLVLPSSARLKTPSAVDSSEAESVSPEPLSERAMGPPPRPLSAVARSPGLGGLPHTSISAVGAAATPKSLLSGTGKQPLTNGEQTASPMVDGRPSGPGALEDLSLPEAARKQRSRRSSLAKIDTQLDPPSASSDGTTPRISSRKTPKLGPASTPSSARTPSAVASPSIGGSPIVASTPSALLKDKKDVGKGVRMNKKRGSLSTSGSKLVSPALVPRISPSIKPLLPEGTPLTSATQAMLLASKSNYQNLLEGNHLPGVTYPDSLSTGLTSKRTSHKVAEQGRRNRINEALKEMQSLIPRINSTPNHTGKKGDGLDDGDEDETTASGYTHPGDGPSGGAGGDPKDDNSAKAQGSKAATVEMANEYIRKMQKDHAEQSADLALLRQENEELRKKLAIQLSVNSNTSGDKTMSSNSETSSVSPGAGVAAGRSEIETEKESAAKQSNKENAHMDVDERSSSAETSTPPTRTETKVK